MMPEKDYKKTESSNDPCICPDQDGYIGRKMAAAGKIRLIALDLDGTALRTDKSMSEAVSSSLRRASSLGIHVCVVSGRPYRSLPSELFSMEFIRYAVTSNGAVVCELKTGRRIAESLLTGGQVRGILDLFPDFETFEVLLGGRSYGWAEFVQDPRRFGMTPEGAAYIRRTRTPVENIRSFALEHADELDALDIICTGVTEQREKTDLLRKKIPSLFVTSSVPNLIEISNTGNGKAAGLKLLGDMLNIRPGEMMAFGDAANDLSMIEYAGIGVAMGNAVPELKAAADIITASNDEDGVALTIGRMLKTMEDCIFLRRTANENSGTSNTAHTHGS